MSAPWSDIGIAQGRVLSPLLFDVLVDNLATNVRQFVPGVRLAASPHRFSHQLYADDLVAVADCEHDLLVTCDVVAERARKWRFTFEVGTTQSAVMVFGPGRTTVGCSDFSWGSSPTGCRIPIPWRDSHHLPFLCSSFAQCVSWCSSERFPVQFASHPFLTYVVPSVSWGCKFCLGSAPAMRLLDGALRRWSRCLLGWPHGSPNAAVHVEVGWPDAQRLVTGRLLSLYGRLSSLPGDRSPLPALVFHVLSVSPNSLQYSLCFPADHHANPFRRWSWVLCPPSGSGLLSVWSLHWTEHSMTVCLPKLSPSPSIMWISGRSR